MSRPSALRPPVDWIVLAAAALVFLPLLSSPALAGDNPRLGILGDVRVEKGEVYPNDLVCIGGTATVEGKVEGDVVVIGGKLDLSGEARDVVAVGTRAKIAPGAVIDGDLIHVMGTLEKDPGVEVQGQTIDVGSRLPHNIRRLLSHGLLGLIVVFRAVSLIFSLVLLLLLSVIAPERISRMSGALEDRWPGSLGFGLLASIVSCVLFFFLLITIIGIPLAILLWLVVKILGLMGIAAIMALLGRRVGLGTGLIGPEASLIATVVVGFLVVALVRFIPFFIGELAWLILSVIGLGLALVTKVGSPSAAPTAS